MNDLRYAWRMLMKHPGFSTVAVTTLLLGIGANTAIFSFVNAILLRPLPYRDPGQLVRVMKEQRANASMPALGGGELVGGNEYLAWRDQAKSFAAVAAYDGSNYNLTGDGDAERIACGRITANFLPALGIQPMLGRSFLEEEDKPNAPKVAILSHGIWTRRFAASPSVLGRVIRMNNEPRRVNMVLLGVFSGLALLLSAVSIYGVMSYSIAQRTREFGIRLALGAQSSEVRNMVVRQGMALAAWGIGLGIVAAFFITRLLTGLLWGVEAADPATFAQVSVALAAVAWLACCLPALRATRIDPMVALRYE